MSSTSPGLPVVSVPPALTTSDSPQGGPGAAGDLECFGRSATPAHRVMEKFGDFCEQFTNRDDFMDLDRRAAQIVAMMQATTNKPPSSTTLTPQERSVAVSVATPQQGPWTPPSRTLDPNAPVSVLRAATTGVSPDPPLRHASAAAIERDIRALGKQAAFAVLRASQQQVVNTSLSIDTTPTQGPVSSSLLRARRRADSMAAAFPNAGPEAAGSSELGSAELPPPNSSFPVNRSLAGPAPTTSSHNHSDHEQEPHSPLGSQQFSGPSSTKAGAAPLTTVWTGSRTPGGDLNGSGTVPPSPAVGTPFIVEGLAASSSDRRIRDLVKALYTMMTLYLTASWQNLNSGQKISELTAKAEEAESRAEAAEAKAEAAVAAQKHAEDQLMIATQQTNSGGSAMQGRPKPTTLTQFASSGSMASGGYTPSATIGAKLAVARVHASGGRPGSGRKPVSPLRSPIRSPLRSPLRSPAARSPLRSPHGRSPLRSPNVPHPTASVAESDSHNLGSQHSYGSMANLLRDALSGHMRTSHKATVDVDDVDGSLMVNQYLIYEEVGAGAQGRVCLGIDTTTSELRAIKEIPRPKTTMGNTVQQLQREIAIMKRVRHRNVVTMYEVIDDPEAHAMYLVMQYVENGALANISLRDGTTKPISPDRLASFARQLCAGLHYLHQRNVVHRDIKPENILLGQNDQVFLADFGISSFVDADKSVNNEHMPSTLITEPTAVALARSGTGVTTSAPDLQLENTSTVMIPKAPQHGTPVFQSPELMNNDHGESFKPSDVWALGLSLYVMLYGQLPFELGFSYITSVVEKDIDFPQDLPPTTEPGSPAMSLPQVPSMFEKSGGDPRSASATLLPSHAPPPVVRRPELPFRDEWLELLKGMLTKDPKRRCTADEAHRMAKALDLKFQQAKMVKSVAEPDLLNAITTRRSGAAGGSGSNVLGGVSGSISPRAVVSPAP